MEIKNLKEFKKLMKKYQELIDNPDLIPDFKEDEIGIDVMSIITGFGNKTTCKLCIYNCEECIWFNDIYLNCAKRSNNLSYEMIEKAQNKPELIEGLKARIERMKERLIEIGEFDQDTSYIDICDKHIKNLNNKTNE